MNAPKSAVSQIIKIQQTKNVYHAKNTLSMILQLKIVLTNAPTNILEPLTQMPVWPIVTLTPILI